MKTNDGTDVTVAIHEHAAHHMFKSRKNQAHCNDNRDKPKASSNTSVTVGCPSCSLGFKLKNLLLYLFLYERFKPCFTMNFILLYLKLFFECEMKVVWQNVCAEIINEKSIYLPH